MSKLPRYCWDTSVFLGWLNQEASAPLADIEVILNEIYAGEAVLIVPVVIYTEVLSAKHTVAQQEAFDKFLLRSGVERVDGTFEIARKAEEIRSRGITLAKKKSEERKIRTPDATIIATAIVQKADVLHSLEPKHHALSGTQIVDGLKICPPISLSGQKGLLPPS